jgi:dephospho-CoA kinase
MTVIVGITGTIGSGKSTVGRLLEEHGVPVFDTDHMVHAMLSDDGPVRAAVVARFGAGIQNTNGAINRPKLGAIVFADPKCRKDLEAIVHPAVRRRVKELVDEHKDEQVVAFLVPLLFEAGTEAQYDQIWTVVSDEETLRKRLISRDNMTDAQADRRLAAQMPQSEKAARAHTVIDNSGSLEQTKEEVNIALERLKAAHK